MQEDTVVTTEESPSKSKLALVFFLIISLLLLFIVLTQDPTRGGPVLILTFLGMLFIWLATSLWLILGLLARSIKKETSTVRRLYTSLALATGLIFLVGLQTLGQLQLADIILVAVFELLLNFYLLRRF